MLAAVADDYGCPSIDARASAPMATRADASARRAPICSTHSPTCRARAQPRAGAVAMARCPHMYAARLVRDHWVVPGSAWGCLPARFVCNERTITSAGHKPEGIAGPRAVTKTLTYRCTQPARAAHASGCSAVTHTPLWRKLPGTTSPRVDWGAGNLGGGYLLRCGGARNSARHCPRGDLRA